MSSENKIENIFIIGGTGNIGSTVVRVLIKNQINVTLLARSIEKVNKLFENEKDIENIKIIESNYKDIEKIKNNIDNNKYDRLFLLTTEEMADDTDYIIELAKIFYESCCKQIVFISSLGITFPYRTYNIGYKLRIIEDGILNEADKRKKYFVALRPGQFFSNQLWTSNVIKNESIIFSSGDSETKATWIDTDDIANFATNILLDDIEKHECFVYELGSEVLTHKQRAILFSNILNCEIKFVKYDIKKMYDSLIKIGFSHVNAYNLSEIMTRDVDNFTPGIELILGRKPKTMKTWIEENKDKFM